MRTTILLCAVCLAMFAGAANAQTQSYFDHVDVATPDLDTGKAWYVQHLGGRLDSRPDHVWFSNTWFVVLLKSSTAKPSAESPIEHLAFSFPDIDAKVKELVAAGSKVVTPVQNVRGWFKTAVVDEPHGLRIELIEDPATTGFHHIHMKVPDPDSVSKWFQRFLGGKPIKVKNVSGLQYGDFRLLIDKGAPKAPSAGTVTDHLAFRVEKASYDPLMADMKAQNVPVQKAPQSYKVGAISGTSGYIEGPAATRIEVLERTPNYQPPN
jgi:lactoylglutathione lyase